MEELVVLREYAKYAYNWAEYYNDSELRNAHFLLAMLSYGGDNPIVYAITACKVVNIELLMDLLKRDCEEKSVENKLNKEVVFSNDLVNILKVLSKKTASLKPEKQLEVDSVDYFIYFLTQQTDLSYIFNKYPKISKQNIEKGVEEFYSELTTQFIEVEIGDDGYYENKPSNPDKMPLFCKNMMDVENVDVYFDRKSIIDECFITLAKCYKKNIMLVGEAGVGKSKIVDIIANKIKNNDCPSILKDKILISLDANALIAGTKMRGEFEAKIQQLIGFLLRNKNHILFADEFHSLSGGNSNFGDEFLNNFKPYLATGEITMIGATTLSEYTQYVEKDKALIRRFEKIEICEPTEEETICILKNTRDNIYKKSKIFIEDNIIPHVLNLSKIVKPNFKNPDASISILDEFAANIRVNPNWEKQSILELNNVINELESAIQLIVELGTYEDILHIKTKYVQIKHKIAAGDILDVKIDSVEDLLNWINTKYKFEYNLKSGAVNFEANRLRDVLNERILAQKEAIDDMVDTILLSKHRIKSDKPMASILMCGNTGTGKTMSAKILADNLFPTQNNMIKIDCSELSQSIDVNKLIGSPAGYIGYDDGGILTNFVKNNPRCVILFDEIEKAHRSIYNLTLQMLNDGVLTDSKGDKVNFSNAIIIFTTNVGAEDTQKKISFGNNTPQENNKIEKFFPPEFIGRLSCVANFKPLSEETVDKIIIREIALKFKEFGILNKSPETYLSSIKTHLNLKLGVRNIQNAIEKYIILPIINEKNNTLIGGVDFSKNNKDTFVLYDTGAGKYI